MMQNTGRDTVSDGIVPQHGPFANVRIPVHAGRWLHALCQQATELPNPSIVDWPSLTKGAQLNDALASQPALSVRQAAGRVLQPASAEPE